MYDVYDNELSEFLQPPIQTRTAFQDFRDSSLATSLLGTAEQAFSLLEWEAETILTQLMESTYSSGIPTRSTSFCFSKERLANLRKYFAFLRFRNSRKYQTTFCSLNEPSPSAPHDRIFSAYLPAIMEHRARTMLRTMMAFLQHSPLESPSPPRSVHDDTHCTRGVYFDDFRAAMESYCWQLFDAEVCVGVASQDQEFIPSDACFGALSEGFAEDP